ncbi:MAG: hypothetical protein KF802_07790 [Bdellovibrionaceae bacterium]|nr:hypothetical protein [Pseudobdellovibrionaceae bacterium]
MMRSQESLLNARGRSAGLIVTAFSFTVATLFLGYLAFGFLTSLIFSSGFLSGFILWYFIPTATPYEKLKIPYFACLALFFLHRVEEKYMGFFAFLSEVTGVSTPEILSKEVVGLVAISVGSWLSIPFLLRRGYDLGYYFAWTFFTAMGVTELAHWVVFPFLLENPIQYIPGMMSVVLLAPVAWIAMRRLTSGKIKRSLL